MAANGRLGEGKFPNGLDPDAGALSPEEAKIKDLETPSVAHFMTYVARCLRSAP